MIPARLVHLLLVATTLGIGGVAAASKTAVHIEARSLQVLRPRAPEGSRRLLRTVDASPHDTSHDSVAELESDGTVDQEGADTEIAGASVLERTARMLHHQKDAVFPASLLAMQGPGHLAATADPWEASVSAMLSLNQGLRYDCSRRYGQEMLTDLMAERSAHHLCTGSSSTITCHERDPFDVPRYMCELSNVMISAEGTTVSDCQKSGDFDSFAAKQGITENNIFGKYTKFGGLKSVQGPLDCVAKASQKAIVQVPANTRNFYEWYGDWITLWETLAAMKWNPKDVDLYLVGSVSGDGREFARPFDEAWSRAFPVGRVHVGSYEALFGKGICFPQMVTAPQGELSTMTFDGGRAGIVGCSSPLIMASALFLQALFPPPAPPAAPSATKTLTLVLRTGMRKFKSDNDTIDAVKQVLPHDWTLRIYQPENSTNLAEQLNIAASTQVFVGVHGAGMMHVLFLPPKARVVEIFCEDRPGENHHYRNLEVMGETGVGPHLFSYYFESEGLRYCKVDAKAVSAAIKAYDSNPTSSAEFSLQ